MAFIRANLLINRGTFNSSSNINNIVIQTYNHDADTLATISGANYFPAFLGADASEVRVGDQLTVKGSDDTQTFEVVTLNPITLTSTVPSNSVDGPATSTVNAAAVWGNTTGSLLANSALLISGNNAALPAAGILSADNISEVTPGNGVLIDGTTAKDGGVLLATSGGTPTSLDYYERDAAIPALTMVPNAGTAAWTISGKMTRVGDVVTLTLTGGSVSATVAGSAVSFFTSSNPLDAQFRPQDANVTKVVAIEDNSTREAVPGLIEIFTGGSVVVSKGIDLVPTWAIGNTAGLLGVSISWTR